MNVFHMAFYAAPDPGAFPYVVSRRPFRKLKPRDMRSGAGSTFS
jgi:hypothetical protein